MNSGAVLVVEDESLVLLDIEHSLREAGFEVIAVDKGDNAIVTFDRNQNGVAALLTDIRIGEGPTGWDIARHCGPSTPVCQSFT